jgi:hypothetical protein
MFISFLLELYLIRLSRDGIRRHHRLTPHYFVTCKTPKQTAEPGKSRPCTKRSRIPMNKPLVKDTSPTEITEKTAADIRPMAMAALRMLVYAIAMLVAVLCMTWEAKHAPRKTLFSEQSLLEALQEVILFLSALVCLAMAKVTEDDRALAFILAGASTIAFVREFDFFLDEYLFDGAWQMLALAVFITVCIAVYKRRHQVFPSINRFLRRPSFGVMTSGFLIVFVFSRMFGRDVLWRAVMNEHYIRAVKNLAEEGNELLGYILILTAVVELFFEILRTRKT